MNNDSKVNEEINIGNEIADFLKLEIIKNGVDNAITEAGLKFNFPIMKIITLALKLDKQL